MAGRPGHRHRGAAIARDGTIRALTPADRPALVDFMAGHWGSTQMAGHGQLFDIPDLPGFVAERAVHRAAVNDARRALKPEIPVTGSFGIPMRDELQLELPSAAWDDIIARHRWPRS